MLWNEVLMKQDFTTFGSQRFRQDILHLEGIARKFGGVSHTAMMPKILEASELLSLPVNSKNGPSLTDVSKALFGGKEESEEVVQKTLRFTVLTHIDARRVMQRRREAVDY